MTTQVTMPKLGIVMIEGTISRWLKEPGQEVQRGEPLIEIATDKITYELEAPEAGRFQPVVEIGATVPVDGLLAYLLSPGEAAPTGDGAAPAQTAAPAQAPPPQVAAASPTTPAAETPAPEAAQAQAPPAAATPPPQTPPAREVASPPQPPLAAAPAQPQASPAREVAPQRQVERVIASPAARKAAEEQGLDLTQVKGTGPGGRIVYEDVVRALEQQAAAPPGRPSPVAGPGGPLTVRERIPLTAMRRLIAERMMQSLATTAQVTLSTQAEATQLVRVREQLSRAERDAGRTAVPYDAIIAKIVARALRDHPILNSAVDGEEIVIFAEVNIAIAVSVEDGLVAPVITNVDQKSLPEVSQEIVAVAERARNRALTLDDLTGGTFGISNLGLYGVESFTPILIPPQTGILGLGAIAHRPVAVDNDHVEVRQTMALSLTFDHRVTDGVPAGRFLQRVRDLIESPWLLFW